MVVRFYEMLLLSTKWPRPLGRREISKWTKIWGILLGHALFARRIWEEDTICTETFVQSGSCVKRVLTLVDVEVVKDIVTFNEEKDEYHCCINDYSFDALQAYCFGINIKL